MKNRFLKIWNKALKWWDYACHGVWSDSRASIKVSIIKTLNITVKSFFNTDIQTQACAMTYRTLLAIVPALALLFAIGRGFGFQNLLQDELYRMLPSQRKMLLYALKFVDSYLTQASEGIFVGVGIVFLLWTLISLISSVEDAFNLIWGIKQGRTFWRKITDYTAMFLILPVLMICGSGLSIFVNNTISSFFDFPFISPLLSVFFEIASYIFACLFFAAVFILIPNTKVNIKNALISGAFTGTAFIILQWLFVSGQLYVSKYNAIYGSFSFLPLLLLWMQLVWVICFTGCLICYASQNIFQYSFNEQISDISKCYKDMVIIAITAVVVQRFIDQKQPVTNEQLTKMYGLPSRLVSLITDKLHEVGIFSRVLIDEKNEIIGFQPAISPDLITIGLVERKICEEGYSNFIPEFDKNFNGVVDAVSKIYDTTSNVSFQIRVQDLKINIEP